MKSSRISVQPYRRRKLRPCASKPKVKRQGSSRKNLQDKGTPGLTHRVLCTVYFRGTDRSRRDQSAQPARRAVLQALQKAGIRLTENTAQGENLFAETQRGLNLAVRVRDVDSPQSALPRAPDRPPPDAAPCNHPSPKSRTNHAVSYPDILKLAGCDNIEAAVRKRKLLQERTAIRSAAKRSQRRVMLGELGKPRQKEGHTERVVPGGQQKLRATFANNTLEAFGIIGA